MTAAPPPLLKRAVTARGPFVMPFHDHVTTLSDAGCQTPSLTEEHLNMRIWRHRSVRTLTALVATGALAVAASSTASADLVVNGVDDSVDSTVELMPLALGGAPGRTTIYVVVSDDRRHRRGVQLRRAERDPHREHRVRQPRGRHRVP